MGTPGRVTQGLPLRVQRRKNPPKSTTVTRRAIRRKERRASTQRNTRWTMRATQIEGQGRSLPESAMMRMTAIPMTVPGENHLKSTMRVRVVMKMTGIKKTQRKSVTRIKATAVTAVTAVATATLPDVRSESQRKTSQGITELGLPTRIRQHLHAKAITFNHPSLTTNASAAKADMVAMQHPMTMSMQDRATIRVTQATAVTKEQGMKGLATLFQANTNGNMIIPLMATSEATAHL